MKDHRAINRRRLLKSAGAAALAFPMINTGAYQVFAAADTTYSAKAVDLVRSTQVFDMLSAPYDFGPMMLALFTDRPKIEDGLKITEEHMKMVLSSGIDVFHPAVGLGADEAMEYISRLIVIDYYDFSIGVMF